MKEYYVMYLPTGRLQTNREGKLLVLTGNSERGAKAKYTRDGGYFNWTFYSLCEVANELS